MNVLFYAGIGVAFISLPFIVLAMEDSEECTFGEGSGPLNIPQNIIPECEGGLGERLLYGLLAILCIVIGGIILKRSKH